MDPIQREALSSYVSIIEKYIAGAISPSGFERAFLTLFKNDPVELPAEVFKALDKLFGDVDAYCGDPALRDEEDLSDEDLMASAIIVLAMLR